MLKITCHQVKKKKKKMRHLNFWIFKHKEKILLKIVEWCQKNNKKIQEIKYEDIVEALASPIRNS
jgi:hypothetical protein